MYLPSDTCAAGANVAQPLLIGCVTRFPSHYPGVNSVWGSQAHPADGIDKVLVLAEVLDPTLGVISTHTIDCLSYR